jgi:hypothetical protein
LFEEKEGNKMQAQAMLADSEAVSYRFWKGNVLWLLI